MKHEQFFISGKFGDINFHRKESSWTLQGTQQQLYYYCFYLLFEEFLSKRCLKNLNEGKICLGLYLAIQQIQLQIVHKTMNQSSVITDVNIVGFPPTLKHVIETFVAWSFVTKAITSLFYCILLLQGKRIINFNSLIWQK